MKKREICFQALSRKPMLICSCKILKALKINSHLFVRSNVATQLASVLNDNCKQLEHLYIRTIKLVFFELFTPPNKFTCLLPLYYDLVKIYDNYRFAVPMKLKSKMVDFRDDELNTMTLNLINSETVEHLAANRWNVMYNGLI